MIDLDSLSVKVECSPIDQFQFVVHMKYKGKEWTKNKTFGEFEELQQLFVMNDICDVPLLPNVDYYAEYNILDDAQNIAPILNDFLTKLFRRPDTRNTTHLLTFVELIQHLNYIPKPVQSEYLYDTGEYTLSVSDLVYVESSRLYIVSYEEKTVLSKLGKLWSIIEPDIMGSIRIFKENGEEFKMEYEETFVTKVRCLVYDEETDILYVGLGNGCMDRYKLNRDDINLEYLDKLILHEGAILSMTLTKERLYTSGYDGSIRCVDIKKNEIISGGKLNKRLNGDRLITSTALNDDVMLLGTCNNNVYFYYMNKNPPLFINNITVQQPCTIKNIIAHSKNVFILHGNCISCHPLTKTSTKTGSEDNHGKLHENDIELSSINSNNKIINVPSSIRSAQFSINDSSSIFYALGVYNIVLRRELKQIIAAYDECVAIWCLTTGHMLYCWNAHRNEQIHVIRLIRNDILLTGGSEGNVKLWRLPNSEDLILWSP